MICRTGTVVAKAGAIVVVSIVAVGTLNWKLTFRLYLILQQFLLVGTKSSVVFRTDFLG